MTDTATISLRRDLWRMRKHLPAGLESRLIDAARHGDPVEEAREVGDCEGNVAAYRVWIGKPGHMVYVQLTAACFVVTP
jgi:hypothetical protein